MTFAEYIWLDGTKPTAQLRSKTKVLNHLTSGNPLDPERWPQWGFDGSSTSQADGNSSDRKLIPACVVKDPIRGDGNYLVLCEVAYPDGRPHESNTRAPLRDVLRVNDLHIQDPWGGIEQEYTLFQGAKPLGFIEGREMPDQGQYYCGVGEGKAIGRNLVEAHLEACKIAGLNICGINGEVMPGQWEFQIGGPESSVLKTSDHLWLARWLLYRLGETYDIGVSLAAKPAEGDWNGAGAHYNFSTRSTRQEGGIKTINQICEVLGERVQQHLKVYGTGIEKRLTGQHETCRYDEFKYGVGDRTASIRIPAHVAADGRGYLEDRRPCADADPYEVSRVLCEAVVLVG